MEYLGSLSGLWITLKSPNPKDCCSRDNFTKNSSANTDDRLSEHTNGLDDGDGGCCTNHDKHRVEEMEIEYTDIKYNDVTPTK